MVNDKVLIGYSTGQDVRRPDFYDYLFMMNKPEGCAMIPAHDKSPAVNRNSIIEVAQRDGFNKILFIDDDQGFKVNALMQLLEHDVDIVSGLYLGGNYPHPPLAFDLADEDDKCCPMYLIGDEERLVPVVAAGFGFLLVKTAIFDKLEKPYLRLGELDSEQWCDDIGFFARTRKAGIQAYVDMECRIGHMKTMMVWPEKGEDGCWYTGYDTGGSTMLRVPQISTSVGYKFEESKVGGGK